MKPKLIRILFSFSLIVFSLFCVERLHAQDALPTDTYEDSEEKEPLYSTGEPFDQRKATPSPVLKDSAAFAPKTLTQQRQTKSAAENAKTDKPSGDDSILSFNFLYYIIQKYKLQDIVD